MYVVVGRSGHVYARTHSAEKAAALLPEIAKNELTNATSFSVEGPVECPHCGHGKPEDAAVPAESAGN